MEESSSAEIQEEANDSIINVSENNESQREANSPSGNESQNGEVDGEANASIGNEHQDRVLANDITKLLESSEPFSSPEYCIFRVPHDIRKLNEEAYTPQVISIGPFHHDNKRLETMEKLKVRYFKIFVEKVALNVENLVSTIRDREGDVRRCYAKTSGLSSDNYVKMILLDASFIIVFFLILSKPLEWGSGDGNIILFTQRLINQVFEDMHLLENQLPFFVIEELYNFAFGNCSNYPSFTQLAFEIVANYNTRKLSPDPNLKIKHFVDLLITFFRLPSHRLPQIGDDDDVGVEHLYTASQLHEAGVKFKVGSSECLFDLKYTNGVLEIPRLKLYNFTESLFRNLVAMEQCHYMYDSGCKVADYICVLDFLIDTSKDVNLLIRKGILFNGLGDSNAITTLVNNLGTNIFISEMNSDYRCLCKDLNSFYEDRWHRWKTILRRDYLSTPCRTVSTLAAIILLMLTFTQTVCSIISLRQI